MSGTGEIIQASFGAIHPQAGRGNAYTEHPIIKKCLEETALDPLAYSKKKKTAKRLSRLQHDSFQINASKTWLGHGTINCFNAAQLENFFQSEEITLRRITTLGKASMITYACSRPKSAALGLVDVEILVHSATNILRATLEAWPNPSTNPRVVKFGAGRRGRAPRQRRRRRRRRAQARRARASGWWLRWRFSTMNSTQESSGEGPSTSEEGKPFRRATLSGRLAGLFHCALGLLQLCEVTSIDLPWKPVID